MRHILTAVQTAPAVVLALLVASCASTGSTAGAHSGRSITSRPGQSQAQSAVASSKTPSSRPEVVIPNTTKKAVVDALASQMLAQGYSIGKIEDYRAQFEKPGGFWLNVLAGSKFNSTAVWRVTYSLLDTPGGVRVIAEMGAVTNPGSGFEKVTEIKGGKNAVAVQSILDEVKNETGRVAMPAMPAAVTDSTAAK